MHMKATIAKTDFAYLKIADTIEQQILNGTLEPGQKLPSIRTICREYGISQNTAINAYHTLERKLLIESRPQSGYFVRFSKRRQPSLPAVTSPAAIAHDADNDRIVQVVYESLGEEGHLPLALGFPANGLLPLDKLNKGLAKAARTLNGTAVSYEKTEGNERLRQQIARWSFAMDANLSSSDIMTTNGCLNAISYCLMAITKKGDTVAMESPVSFGMLQLAEVLGLKVLELPTDPQTGVDLNALEDALRKGLINCCLFISNFSNPLGSCMPDEHKKRAVQLLTNYSIPLIENDINGDVYFGSKRPKSCKTYDVAGLVLWCGSVSKTLAPGYRVGWVAPGKFKDELMRMKRNHTISNTSLTQVVIADFLETGRYENHLRKLRQTLQANLHQYSNTIAGYFPEGTKASRPRGGFVLWVELPKEIDTMLLYEKCLQAKIGFAPGRIFTLQNQFNNCLRLNYGLDWNDKLKNDLRYLGELISNVNLI